jgi:hypothetical protein
MVHSWEVECAAQESDALHIGSSHALRPGKGDQEAVEQEVAFGRVEVYVVNSVDYAGKEIPRRGEVARAVSLSRHGSREVVHEDAAGMLEVNPPCVDSGMITLSDEVERVHWGDTTKRARDSVRRVIHYHSAGLRKKG